MLPAVAALVDWYAVARDDRRPRWSRSPLVLVSLIVAAVVLGATDSPAGVWLLVALFFGLRRRRRPARRALARFLAASAAFLRRPPGVRGLLRRARPAPSAGGRASGWSRSRSRWCATRRVLPVDAPGVRRRRCRCPVGVYMAVIGAMLVVRLAHRGAARRRGRDACSSPATRSCRSTGSCGRSPTARLALMVTYHVGQALIVAGVLAA